MAHIDDLMVVHSLQVESIFCQLCFQDVVDYSGQVILGHLMKAVVPVSFVLLGQRCVSIRVGVASAIAQPHVVSQIGQQEGQTVVRARDNPICWVGYNVTLSRR